MKCPACGAPGEGNFCAKCGASLRPVACAACGAALPAAARFCTQCGTPVGRGRQGPVAAAAGGPRAQTMGWWVAGVTLIVLLIIVGLSVVGPGQEQAGASGAAAGSASGAAPFAGGGGGTPPDLSSMTPREAADRLFNRVMTAVSAGDSAQVQSFLPMAIQAYRMVEPLDADGHYHLSELQRTAGQPDSALATARRALADAPDHLLVLAAAAQAARDLGDEAQAREYYGRFVQLYDTERAKALPEYEAHVGQLPDLLAEARARSRP